MSHYTIPPSMFVFFVACFVDAAVILDAQPCLKLCNLSLQAFDLIVVSPVMLHEAPQVRPNDKTD